MTPWIAMTSHPLLSRKYVHVASHQRKKTQANQGVVQKYAKRREGRLITVPPLSITRSQVRVLPGEPTISRSPVPGAALVAKRADVLLTDTGVGEHAGAPSPSLGYLVVTALVLGLFTLLPRVLRIG
jgi:hypothetical protein